MENLIVIRPTWAKRGESFIAHLTNRLVQLLTTIPPEQGFEPELIRLPPDEEKVVLQDFKGERKLHYLEPPAQDDWYIAKLIY